MGAGSRVGTHSHWWCMRKRKRGKASRCGECTLCCTLIQVDALDKPVNTPCEYCTKKGCSIFKDEKRPVACKGFECLWYANPKLPDYLRPDRCNVIFETLGGRKTVIALMPPDKPEAWREPEVMGLIGPMVKSGTAVIASTGKDKNFLLPEGRTVEDVWAEVTDTWEEMNK